MKIPRAAVIGCPIEHSLSPMLFKFIGEKMGRAVDYSKLRIEPDDLPSAVKTAKAESWIGWNVTIPHKVPIVQYLDKLDASAKAVGAVNVVRFHNKTAIGYNTDANGFLEPILQKADFRLKGSKVVVFGAGGAARAVCYALHSRAAKIMVINRTSSHIQPLEKLFGVEAGDMTMAVEAMKAADLVINATPLGMDGKASPLPPKARFRKGSLAYDLIYNPTQTPFLKLAFEQGAWPISGSAMLVGQAVETWRIWFNTKVKEYDAVAVKGQLEEHLKNGISS